MVAALDAVRMGTMSINQVTLTVSLIYGSFQAGPSRVSDSRRAGSGGQTKPQLKTSGNSRGFL